MFDFEAILETPGFRGTGETVVGTARRSDNVHRAKDIHCSLAFLDEKDTLQMIINNREDTAFDFGGIRATQHHSIYGSGFGDGFFVGPTILSKSLGICPFRIDRSPGYCTYLFNVGPLDFDLTFFAPDTDDAGPNPSLIGFPSRGLQIWSDSIGREFNPSRPHVSFDDAKP